MCHTSVCFPFEKHNLLDENCSFFEHDEEQLVSEVFCTLWIPACVLGVHV